MNALLFMVRDGARAPPHHEGNVSRRRSEFPTLLHIASSQNRTSVNSSDLEAAMDDEKSITEKLANAIGKAADSVKNAVSHVVDTASNAAQHAMEANAK